MMNVAEVFLLSPSAPNPAVWGTMGFATQGPARPSSRALPEVCLHQPTLLNANLLPGFVGTQEEAVLGLLPHPTPLCIQTDPKLV